MVARLPVTGSAGAGSDAPSGDGVGRDAAPLLLHGDAVEVLPDAFARVPANACPSSLRRGRCRTSRSRAACDSCTASTKRRPAEPWRGCQRRGSESHRRYGHWAIAAPLDTASSAWRCSTSRLCAPKPLAAAGRRAACWRGWQTPSAAIRATAITRQRQLRDTNVKIAIAAPRSTTRMLRAVWRRYASWLTAYRQMSGPGGRVRRLSLRRDGRLLAHLSAAKVEATRT